MTKMPKVTFFDNIVPFTTMKPKKNNTGKDMCNVCRVVVICRISQFCLSREVIGGDWFAKGRPSYNEQTLHIYILLLFLQKWLCRMFFLTNKHFTKVRFYLCNTLNFSTLWQRYISQQVREYRTRLAYINSCKIEENKGTQQYIQ